MIDILHLISLHYLEIFLKQIELEIEEKLGKINGACIQTVD